MSQASVDFSKVEIIHTQTIRGYAYKYNDIMCLFSGIYTEILKLKIERNYPNTHSHYCSHLYKVLIISQAQRA